LVLLTPRKSRSYSRQMVWFLPPASPRISFLQITAAPRFGFPFSPEFLVLSYPAALSDLMALFSSPELASEPLMRASVFFGCSIPLAVMETSVVDLVMYAPLSSHLQRLLPPLSDSRRHYLPLRSPLPYCGLFFPVRCLPVVLEGLGTLAQATTFPQYPLNRFANLSLTHSNRRYYDTPGLVISATAPFFASCPWRLLPFAQMTGAVVLCCPLVHITSSLAASRSLGSRSPFQHFGCFLRQRA